MLEEKLKEAIVAELKRQAADNPQSLRIESSEKLVVNGQIDLDALVMVIAGSVAGGLDAPRRAAFAIEGEQEQGLSPSVLFKQEGWT